MPLAAQTKLWWWPYFIPSTKNTPMSSLRAGRALARAELGGTSVAETFSLADAKGTDSLSHAEFWEVSACSICTRAQWGYIERSERGPSTLRGPASGFGVDPSWVASACLRQYFLGVPHGNWPEFSIVHASPLFSETSDNTPPDQHKTTWFLGKHPF